MRIRTRRFLQAGFVFLWLCVILWSSIRPSNDREWERGQDRLASAQIDGDTIRLQSVRNFLYRSTTDFDERYEDRMVKLSDLESTWYVVDHLDASRGAAHTFLSFGFTDGTYLSVSVEARRESTETYSVWKGLGKTYELLYVLADEADAVRLRTSIRRHPVRLYKLRLTPEQSRNVFLSALHRMNALQSDPEFYNTLFNACADNVFDHMRDAGLDVRLDWRTAIPGYSDDMLSELGLLSIGILTDARRDASLINEAADAAPQDSRGFSRAIRSDLPSE